MLMMMDDDNNAECKDGDGNDGDIHTAISALSAYGGQKQPLIQLGSLHLYLKHLMMGHTFAQAQDHYGGSYLSLQYYFHCGHYLQVLDQSVSPD